MKQYVTKSKIIALTLAVIFLLSACSGGGNQVVSSVSSYAPADTYTAPERTDIDREDVTIADMVYERPDIDGIRAAIEDLQDEIKHKQDATELFQTYQDIQSQYSHADSMLSLLYLIYAFDVTNTVNREEYAYLQSALTELDAEMETVSYALFESSGEAKQIAAESLGEGYVEAIINDETFDDDSIQSLLDQEEQLTLEYDHLTATFSILDNGVRWTYQDILSDTSLSNDEYYRLYDAYCAQLNEKAGAIFLKQVPIRTEIAKRLGYADYATFCYVSYGRDYTPVDARTLHSAVKQYIAPIFIQANKKMDTYDLDTATFDEDAFFSTLSSTSAAFSPLLGDPVSYMLRNRLYDTRMSDVKMDSSFTTYISDYRAPFIFSTWGGSANDIMTVLHELGHFTSYYHNAEVGYSAGDSLDLAEVDAQALSLLLFDDYKEFFGKYAEQARKATLNDAMYSLLSGCMEDEFQQDIYQNPDMTLSEMNALYARLADEYGLQDVYGYQGTEWVLITHTFQTPMYYISYAASMVPALELFDLSRSNLASAKNAYFNIMLREPYAALDDLLVKNGLRPVFSEDTIAQIAQILKAYTT